MKKNKFYRYKSPIFLKGADIETVSKKNFFAEKTINILLVAYIIIISLNNYI